MLNRPLQKKMYCNIFLCFFCRSRKGLDRELGLAVELQGKDSVQAFGWDQTGKRAPILVCYSHVCHLRDSLHTGDGERQTFVMRTLIGIFSLYACSAS